MFHLLYVNYASINSFKIYWGKYTLVNIKQHDVIELKLRYYTNESLLMLR